jgi:hypothetical protein
MIKILFTCPWTNNENIFNSYKQNTPNSNGKWKNIIGVTNIEEADYIIVLDDLHTSCLDMGIDTFKKKFDSHKVIHFQRENTQILKSNSNNSWYINHILPYIKFHITYEKDFLYTFTNALFINKTYDELKLLQYSDNKKTKKISCIVSSKILSHITPNYEKRVNFIKDYSQTNIDKIDIYGSGWNKNVLGTNYKGDLGSYHTSHNGINDKSDGLLKYHYSICLENLIHERCISEKITDALLCWCMPIYWGNSCIEKYFPNQSFKLIDIENKNVLENINDIINKNPTDEEIEHIKEARDIILDKLNIWEQIYQIINNYDDFLKNYKL